MMRLLSWICVFLLRNVAQSDRDAERDALTQLFYSTRGENWRFAEGWTDVEIDHCNWPYIECEPRKMGNVVKIDLEHQYLEGTVPVALTSLSSLTYLRLHKNKKLGGTIPAEFFSMPNLENLDLGDNALTGTIPDDVNKGTKLKELNLLYNKLEGTIPDLSRLNKLQILSFAGNQLSGTIPQLQGLGALTRYSVYSNKLTGRFPSFAHQMKYLQNLYLDDNQLTGTIPANMGSHMPDLRDLHISKNKLTGPIPPSVSYWKNLTIFYAFENQLTGSLPDDWVNMDEMKFLNISYNKLTGTFPVGMKNFERLVEFDVGHNNFNGPIHNDFYMMKKMRIFDISTNAITGTIPKSWKSMTDLEYFRADNNQLIGTLPSEWEDIPYLIEVRLNDNNVCGPMPDWLYTRTMIHTMLLRNNDWFCPLGDYCKDTQKIECDYSEDMHCLNEVFAPNGEDTCTYLRIRPSVTPTLPSPTEIPSSKPSSSIPTNIPTTSIPTNIPTSNIPTAAPSTNIGAAGEYFQEHNIYSNAHCKGEEGVVVLTLPDIVGYVGCGQEAWKEPRCGYWYSFSPARKHCVCVLAGKRCKKETETGSQVYKITSDHEKPHEELRLMKRFEMRDDLNIEHLAEDSDHQTSPAVYFLIAFLTTVFFGVIVQYCMHSRSKPHSLDDVLLDVQNT